jgi:uncharacterized protein YbjT (DUF2867 family)
MTETTLVLGGTGKTGRRVAARLTARGLPIRIGSRSGEPPFDWHDRSTWAPVLRGVRSAYVVYYPDLAFPGAAAAIRAFAEQAVAAQVRRLVLLSGRGEEEAQVSEQGVRDSGAEWTILRASWFSQDFSEDFLLEPARSGVIAVPAGDVPEPFVDCEDVADVAVAALTEDGHAGQTYELTGPRLLTFADAADEIAKATGREVRYVPVTPEEYASELGQFVPAEHVAALTDLFVNVLDGRNAHVTDGVQRALGRPARDFTEFAREAAAGGVWSS